MGSTDGRPADLSPLETACWEALSIAQRAGFYPVPGGYSATGDHEHIVYMRVTPGHHVDMLEISGVTPSFRAHGVRCSETPLVLPYGGKDGADQEWNGTPAEVIEGMI
jgi:hypothetical protein